MGGGIKSNNIDERAKMLKLLISCFFCLIATVAAANEVLDIRSCNTSIRGNIISLKYDANSHWSGTNPWLAENFTLREKVAILSKKLPWQKDQNLNCPSIILPFLVGFICRIKQPVLVSLRGLSRL